MELLSFSIAAGETKRFERAGRYLEIIDAQAAVDVFLTDSGGSPVDRMLAALSGMYVEEHFAAFEVANRQGTAQAVVLMVTETRGGSRRQPGNVRVIDTNRATTVDGRSWLVPNSQAAVAARLLRAGVWVPAGQSNRIVIERIEFSTSGAATPFQIVTISAAPATVNALGAGVAAKRTGGPSPLSFLRAFDDVAAGVGTTMYVKTAVSSVYEPKTPIVVLPGFGVVVVNNTAGQDMASNFDVIEEPNV